MFPNDGLWICNFARSKKAAHGLWCYMYLLYTENINYQRILTQKPTFLRGIIIIVFVFILYYWVEYLICNLIITHSLVFLHDCHITYARLICVFNIIQNYGYTHYRTICMYPRETSKLRWNLRLNTMFSTITPWNNRNFNKYTVKPFADRSFRLYNKIIKI